MTSFEHDIAAGFDLLHIDTCLDAGGEATVPAAAERLLKLYGECCEVARRAGRNLRFEIGLEGQTADAEDPEEFRESTTSLTRRLHHRSLPPPTFIVAQTATKVIAARNVGGVLLCPLAVMHTVRHLANACEDVKAGLKAHNADYLPPPVVARLMRNGVSAMNVAPELGVLETQSFLQILERSGQRVLQDRFLALAYESRAWEKWVGKDEAPTDIERAILAGHYVFASQEFADIKQQAAVATNTTCEVIDRRLREAVGARIAQLLNSAGERATPQAA
jgi:hypothetical protein